MSSSPERPARHARKMVSSEPAVAPSVAGVVCENPECRSPFPLAPAWCMRAVPTRGTMRLCAGCAAEVDRNRVCETCHEIYVAAKATPQTWALCTRCSGGAHFVCGSVPCPSDYIGISFLCRTCRGPDDLALVPKKFKATGSTKDRVCGNVVCHKPNSSRWVRRPYQGKLQWLCSACGACLDSGKCCPHCEQIYRQGDEENFDGKRWVGCDLCNRWVHVHCEVVRDEYDAAYCLENPNRAFHCPDCRARGGQKPVKVPKSARKAAAIAATNAAIAASSAAAAASQVSPRAVSRKRKPAAVESRKSSGEVPLTKVSKVWQPHPDQVDHSDSLSESSEEFSDDDVPVAATVGPSVGGKVPNWPVGDNEYELEHETDAEALEAEADAKEQDSSFEFSALQSLLASHSHPRHSHVAAGLRAWADGCYFMLEGGDPMYMVLVPTPDGPLPGASTVRVNDRLYSYALADGNAVKAAGFSPHPSASLTSGGGSSTPSQRRVYDLPARRVTMGDNDSSNWWRCTRPSCGKWRRVPAQASEAPFSWISDAAASSDATRRAAEPLSGHTRNRLQSLAVADQKPNSSNSDAIQWFHFTCRYNPDATHADCSVPEESLTATEQIAKHQGATSLAPCLEMFNLRRRALFSALQIPLPSELAFPLSPQMSTAGSVSPDPSDLLIYAAALRRGGAAMLDRLGGTGGASMRGWRCLLRDLRWLSSSQTGYVPSGANVADSAAAARKLRALYVQRCLPMELLDVRRIPLSELRTALVAASAAPPPQVSNANLLAQTRNLSATSLQQFHPMLHNQSQSFPHFSGARRGIGPSSDNSPASFSGAYPQFQPPVLSNSHHPFHSIGQSRPEGVGNLGGILGTFSAPSSTYLTSSANAMLPTPIHTPLLSAVTGASSQAVSSSSLISPNGGFSLLGTGKLSSHIHSHTMPSIGASLIRSASGPNGSYESPSNAASLPQSPSMYLNSSGVFPHSNNAVVASNVLRAAHSPALAAASAPSMSFSPSLGPAAVQIPSPSQRVCMQCGGGNGPTASQHSLLYCAACRRAALHPQCAVGELMVLPNSMWICPSCVDTHNMSSKLVPLKSLRAQLTRTGSASPSMSGASGPAFNAAAVPSPLVAPLSSTQPHFSPRLPALRLGTSTTATAAVAAESSKVQVSIPASMSLNPSVGSYFDMMTSTSATKRTVDTQAQLSPTGRSAGFGAARPVSSPSSALELLRSARRATGSKQSPVSSDSLAAPGSARTVMQSMQTQRTVTDEAVGTEPSTNKGPNPE